MNTRKILYVLRHCEVEKQYDGVFRGGKLDCDLSEQGKADSEQRADFLLHKGVERVITSGMKRTNYVGSILAEHGVSYVMQPLFAEIDFGYWNGKSAEQASSEFKKEYQEYRRCWEEKRGEDIVIPGGETMKEVLERVGKCWEETKQELAPVSAIVLHSVSMTCLLSRIMKKSIKEIPYTELGGMHEIVLDGDQVALVS